MAILPSRPGPCRRRQDISATAGALPDRYGGDASLAIYVDLAKRGFRHLIDIPDLAEGIRGLEQAGASISRIGSLQARLDAVVFRPSLMWRRPMPM